MKSILFGVEEGPVVLDHIFTPILSDGLDVAFFIFIGVAIDLGDIDIAFVMALNESVFDIGFL